MSAMKYIKFLFILITGIILVQCDIKNSDIENDKSFIRIYYDNDLNINYHPLDVVELSNGFLILSTKIQVNDSTTYSWENHLPFIIKTDLDGNVEWTTNGERPYVSPIADILEINGDYYFFALETTGKTPTLFQINLSSEDIDFISTGNFGSNTFALNSIVDSEGNILLLNNNYKNFDAELYKISGLPDNIQSNRIAVMVNRVTNGEKRIRPIILEHLSHYNKRYPFSIKEYKNNNNLDSYIVNCFENELLSLYNINVNNSIQGNWIIGSITGTENKVYVASYQQLNDSIVGFVKNDNNKISIQPNLLLGNNNNGYDINNLSETTDFIELDGQSLIPSGIINYNDVEYLFIAIATKGEQVALFIYDTETYGLHNIYYMGSTNDIAPVTIKQTNDDGLLVLCKTLVTNKYPRIALYKIPLKEIGLE